MNTIKSVTVFLIAVLVVLLGLLSLKKLTTHQKVNLAMTPDPVRAAQVAAANCKTVMTPWGACLAAGTYNGDPVLLMGHNPYVAGSVDINFHEGTVSLVRCDAGGLCPSNSACPRSRRPAQKVRQRKTGFQGTEPREHLIVGT